MMAKSRAFVCGHPIAHSRSPMIHGHWLALHGIDGTYEAIDVSPAAFSAFLSELQADGYAGGNVTIPHKEAAFAAVSVRDAAAEAIGAVNTLWFEGAKLVGGNTDAYGFSANLDGGAPQWRSVDHALVIGAGGAARAVIHALATAGIGRITIANRTRERAEDLCHLAPTSATVIEMAAIAQIVPHANLVINTTSLGMDGQATLKIDLSRAQPDTIVADIVYVPLETPLLAEARQNGLIAVDGLGMLLHQAVPGFERWFGLRPNVTPDLRALIVADIEKASH